MLNGRRAEDGSPFSIVGKIMEDEERKYSVYIHILPKAVSGYDHDKYYVGMTGMKINERWNNGKSYKCSVYFNNAIKKYGWKNFEHEVIASHLTKEEAKDFEILMISKLDSTNPEYGYNLLKGGNIHDNFGVSVVQYDLDGNYINTYKSKTEAAEAIGKPGMDRRILSGVSAGGFMWRICEQDEVPPQKIAPYQRNKDIIQTVDLSDIETGKYIETLTVTEAAQKYNISRSMVKLYCDKEDKNKNVRWHWSGKNDHWDPVYVYNLDGIFLNGFSSISDALRYTNYTSFMSPSRFNKICSNIYFNQLHEYRYTREYYFDLPKLIPKLVFKPIIQYNITSKVIQDIFYTRSQAKQKLNIPEGTIEYCCHHPGATSFSNFSLCFIWDIDKLGLKYKRKDQKEYINAIKALLETRPERR